MTSIELPPPPTGTDIYADRHTELVVFTVVIYAFAVLFCSLRFLSRRYSGYGFWIDDYLIIPAAILCTANSALVISGPYFGRHVWAIGYNAQVYQLKLLFAEEIIYQTNLLVLKCSALALYWRIFSVSRLRYFIWGILGFTFVWYLAVMVGTCLQCYPLSKSWDVFEPGSCSQTSAIFAATASVHILIDVILFVMPIPLVWRLNAARSQKFLILGTFMLGSFPIILSSLRLSFLYELNVLSSFDLSWAFTDVVLWSTIEIQCSVIAVCAPTLRPCYKYLRTGSFTGSINSKESSGRRSPNVRGEISWLNRNRGRPIELDTGMSHFAQLTEQWERGSAALSGRHGGVGAPTSAFADIEKDGARESVEQIPSTDAHKMNT